MSAGAAGDVNCLDVDQHLEMMVSGEEGSYSEVTKPESEHDTPDQVQTLRSLPHLPFESTVCPVEFVVSKMARSPQNWSTFAASVLLVMFDRTGRQVEQG
jgi:hypothetical protein